MEKAQAGEGRNVEHVALEDDATLALDPVLRTTGRVTAGNGGEIAIGTAATRNDSRRLSPTGVSSC